MGKFFTDPVINIIMFDSNITMSAETISNVNPRYYNSHEKIMMKAKELGYNSHFTAILQWKE